MKSCREMSVRQAVGRLAHHKLPALAQQCILESYSGLTACRLVSAPVPRITSPTQVLVRVKAASLNPLDLRMSQGYGAQILNTLRCAESTLTGQQKSSEFPLVLGRDFSGEIVDIGTSVDCFSLGDEVFGATFPSQAGSHQEYVAVHTSSICRKPSNLTHVQSSAIPYAGLTAWAALVTTGGLLLAGGGGRRRQERVLVLGAAGGVGSLAAQLAARAGAAVVAVAGPDSQESLQSLGVAATLNYKADDYTHQLISLSGFDIILDAAGLGQRASELVPLLAPGGRIVLLDSPLLKYTDSQGLLAGSVRSAADLVSSNLRALTYRNTVRWAYFTSSTQGLRHLSELAEGGRLRPLIGKVLPLAEVAAAYQLLEERTRGKIVLQM